MSVHRNFNPTKRKHVRKHVRKAFGPGKFVKLPGDPRTKREIAAAALKRARQALLDAGAVVSPDPT